ncbi:MAG TPA: TonB family protein [Longimicrobiales bacterium]
MEEQQQMFAHLIASKPRREGRAATAATLVSLLFHGALVAGLVWATLAVGQETEEPEEQVTLFQLPEEEPIPPPPPPPPPPEVRVEAPPEALEDVPRGFQTLSMPTVILPEIPPPSTFATNELDFSGEGVEGGKADGKAVEGGTGDVYAGPMFTPYTVAPELKNREEVARALSRYYPPLLRDAGIGGTVLVWFLIDEEGKVRKYQVKESSGHEALDEAALKVADIMRFSPALNRDRKVTVWVALPITFTVR